MHNPWVQSKSISDDENEIVFPLGGAQRLLQLFQLHGPIPAAFWKDAEKMWKVGEMWMYIWTLYLEEAKCW